MTAGRRNAERAYGLDFETAQRVFDDPLAVSVQWIVPRRGALANRRSHRPSHRPRRPMALYDPKRDEEIGRIILPATKK